MTFLETLQLIGYSLGAVLPLWLGYLVAKQRLGLVPIPPLLPRLPPWMVGLDRGHLILPVRGVGGLLVDRMRDYRVARSATVIIQKRAPNSVHARDVLHRHCITDSCGPGLWPRQGNDGWSISSDAGKPWFAASFGAARLLHLSLSIS